SRPSSRGATASGWWRGCPSASGPPSSSGFCTTPQATSSTPATGSSDSEGGARDGRGRRDLLPRLRLALAAAQDPQGEDRAAHDRRGSERELDAEQALARPVDVAQVEQQRRLVEDQANARSEGHGERPL